ncbi:Acyl-CoA dehydrogenase [Wickerhamiella sorbophila]|uniref:Acyl-CoA dehydrogenase n=1 Tax=Wickerhamiella sorbophila TaxID=45607 RepID=A0A2T0FCZ8_9ASCO|nr:Acyl-CoA dehydrogenase [Wickerhamiella sorbophila]PRT52851.1 Acyl-CoA dehydrogenase [Wickerhamiella sorbophila]
MSTPVKLPPVSDLLPYTEPDYYQGFYTTYFNETHFALRDEVREFVNEFIVPYVDEWDVAGEVDPNLYREFGRRGYLCALAGVREYPTEYTDIRIKSVPPEKFDPFHEIIIIDEVCRAGSGGVCWFLMGGYNISVPAIFKFGSPALKRRVLPDILAGKKRSCLAITEPDAGSDVANLTTTATLSEDGKHYLVTGTKKWITNGIFSDYFVTATRTGKKGMGGITMLFIERDSQTVDTRKIMTQGMRGSGTTLLNFDETKVPVADVIGEVNGGFKSIMANFNHERLGIIAQATRFSRVLLQASLEWALERETFGTKLINHAVIRSKFGVMAGRIEGVQAWFNDLVLQYKYMDDQEAMVRLGGPIAACKALVTQTMELCAREASQIYGGLSYTQGGKGGTVERLYREVRAFAIPGGSEEIMIDLGVRQTLKDLKKYEQSLKKQTKL